MQDLPDDVLPFLQPSRYVESDLLSQEASNRIGRIGKGWDKVQAICNFVHGHLRSDHEAASPTRRLATGARRAATSLTR